MNRWLVSLGLALHLLSAQAAWPDRAITLVVPFPPGGPIDQVARQLATHLQEALGTPVLVDNKSGAGGTVGTRQVLHAPPDGYTFVVATSSAMITTPQVMAKLPYDGVADFTPVVAMVRYPFLLVGRPDGPATVQALIAQGRKKELTYGSVGIGAGNHLVASHFVQATGMSAVHVPYKGAGATSQGLMSGEIDFVFDSLLSVAGLLPAGKVRALAISSKTRSPSLPDVPTLRESGLPAFDEVIWVGLLGPRGLPAAVVQRMNLESNRLLARAEFRARLQVQGTVAIGGTPDEFAAVLKSDQVRWSRFIADNKIKIE